MEKMLTIAAMKMMMITNPRKMILGMRIMVRETIRSKVEARKIKITTTRL